MLGIIEKIHKDVIKEPWKDDKLITLANTIDDILATEEGDRKILVFSEFEDTVWWVFNGLSKMVVNKKVVHPDLWEGRFDWASSSRKDVEKIAARFSPLSMKKTSSKAIGIGKEEEIDVLIATDVMSEGMNLQDANYVINYDIHWTPYKLIQRIGRIDRIGSKHEKIHVINFLPENELEKNLNLIEKVSKRADEFITALGEDGKIVTEEDAVNKSAMKAIYGGRMEDVESIAEKNILSLTPAAEKALDDFIKNHKKDWEKLKEVISIRSAALHSLPKTAALVVCSNGVHPQYYTYELVNGKWERVYLSLDYFLQGGLNYETPPYTDIDTNNFIEVAEKALKGYFKMLDEMKQIRTHGRMKKSSKEMINRLRTISRSTHMNKTIQGLAMKYYDLMLWGYNHIPVFKNVVDKVSSKKSWKRKNAKEFMGDINDLLDLYSIGARKEEEEMKDDKGEGYLRPHITSILILVKNRNSEGDETNKR